MRVAFLRRAPSKLSQRDPGCNAQPSHASSGTFQLSIILLGGSSSPARLAELRVETAAWEFRGARGRPSLSRGRPLLSLAPRPRLRSREWPKTQVTLFRSGRGSLRESDLGQLR